MSPWFQSKLVPPVNSGSAKHLFHPGNPRLYGRSLQSSWILITGLFDTMSGLPPSTADVIAEKTGLSERYVREWLGPMVTGGG